VKHEQIPTIYVEARASITVEESVKKSLPLLNNYTKIGLATSVQHLQALKSGAGDFNRGWENSDNWRQRSNGLCWASQRLQLQQREIKRR